MSSGRPLDGEAEACQRCCIVGLVVGQALGYHLHQRTGEVRALQDTLALKDREHEALRVQMERQKAAARRDYEALQKELQQAQREFTEALRKVCIRNLPALYLNWPDIVNYCSHLARR